LEHILLFFLLSIWPKKGVYKPNLEIEKNKEWKIIVMDELKSVKQIICSRDDTYQELRARIAEQLKWKPEEVELKSFGDVTHCVDLLLTDENCALFSVLQTIIFKKREKPHPEDPLLPSSDFMDNINIPISPKLPSDIEQIIAKNNSVLSIQLRLLRHLQKEVEKFSQVRNLCMEIMRIYPDETPMDMTIIMPFEDIPWRNIFTLEEVNELLSFYLKETMSVFKVMEECCQFNCDENQNVRYILSGICRTKNFTEMRNALEKAKKQVDEYRFNKNDKEFRKIALNEAKNYWVKNFVFTGGLSSIVELLICNSLLPDNAMICLEILYTVLSRMSSLEKKIVEFPLDISHFVFFELFNIISISSCLSCQ
jgi:hypothetical protein